MIPVLGLASWWWDGVDVLPPPVRLHAEVLMELPEGQALVCKQGRCYHKAHDGKSLFPEPPGSGGELPVGQASIPLVPWSALLMPFHAD